MKTDVGDIEKTSVTKTRDVLILKKKDEFKVASNHISQDLSKLGNSLDDKLKDVAPKNSQSLNVLNEIDINIAS